MQLFKDTLQVDLEDICFKDIEVLQNIAEYEFYLINLEGKTNNIKQELFIKIIKKGKIKESLFCICDLAYENYFSNISSKEKIKGSQRITILEEKETIKDVNKVSVNLFEDVFTQKKYSIEINFTPISSIIEKKLWKGWNKYIDLNYEDILILGRKDSIL